MHEEANRSLDEMVMVIGEIDAESGKISKIIRVIDEIAFQTNILALNAAVEGAECRSGSSAGLRSGHGLCGGGRRGSQPGVAFRAGGK